MTDDDRTQLDVIIELLRGLDLHSKGIRRHVSTVADFTDHTLREILATVKEIRSRSE
jgi:hypothetical protein